MEKNIIIYQTLEDRDNYLDCEKNGPYPCAWENTWLGKGFYFWYHHEKLAIWWGESRYKKKYYIFKSICNNSEKCWDLHGSGEHQEVFYSWLNNLKSRKLFTKNTTVAQVIEFIKNECSTFDYEAIRILGIDSISRVKAEEYKLPRLNFEIPQIKESKSKQRYIAYYDVIPPIQICLFSKNALQRQNFELIFPEHLREDYNGFI